MKKNVIRLLAWVIASALLFFGLLQLVPYGREHTNPPVVKEPQWDSQQTRQLAQRACFDCHSNETAWPWYSNIAPVSWLVQRDVDDARLVMNFSDWDRYWIRADAITEVLQKGEMPPFQYILMHPEARLNAADKATLVKGFQLIR